MDRTGDVLYIKPENLHKDTRYAMSGNKSENLHKDTRYAMSGNNIHQDPNKIDRIDLTKNDSDTSGNSADYTSSLSGANISNGANEVDYTHQPRDYAFLGSEIKDNKISVDLPMGWVQYPNKIDHKVIDLTQQDDSHDTVQPGPNADAEAPNASKSEEAAEPSDDASGFKPGALVRIQGLQTARELNGQEGELVAFNQVKGRWQVKVSGIEKMIKPVNLVILDSSTQAPEQTTASSTQAPDTQVPEPSAGASSTQAPGPNDTADNVPDDNAGDYETIRNRTFLKTSAAYRILGLPQGESKDIIKQTHRKLFKKWQKTSASSSGNVTRKADAERMLRMLNDARSVLIKDNLANQVHTKNPQ